MQNLQHLVWLVVMPVYFVSYKLSLLVLVVGYEFCENLVFGLLAGSGAGVACSMVACPTELVKCRLQAQSALASAVEAPVLAGVGAAGGSAAVKGAVQYSGPMDVARQVIRSEGGVLGLFKGLTPTLMREVPGNAAMFGAYEAVKQYLAGGML